MYSNRATKIVRRAVRSGRTKEAIAEEIGCTTQTLRNWEARDDIAVTRAISRNLLRLQDELRVEKASKGER